MENSPYFSEPSCWPILLLCMILFWKKGSGEGQIGWGNFQFAVGAQSILSNCAVPRILGLWSDQAPAA